MVDYPFLVFMLAVVLALVFYGSHPTQILLVSCLAVLLFRRNQAPLFNLYHRPGKYFYLKYCVLRVLFWLRPRPKADIHELERLQPFSESEQAFDAVFFDGASQEGEYFILGCERRRQGIVNALFYLVTKEEGVLLSEKLPNTELKLASSEKVDYYGAEGIRVQPIQSMRKWLVQYEGKMRSQDNPDRLFHVKFSGFFQSATERYFSFDTDYSGHAMAYSMAKEPWSMEYFRHLKSAHQYHYEQIGTIDATLELGSDAPPRQIGFQVFRDHSYGFQRDWRLMHRFTFQILFLSDGAALIMGNVCQPCTCSDLVIGYLCDERGHYHAIRGSDFRLYQHGEAGRPPLDYAFTVHLDDGSELVVEMEVQGGGVHFVGENRLVKVNERFVKCRVNGVEGRGVSECVYNQAGLRRKVDSVEQ